MFMIINKNKPTSKSSHWQTQYSALCPQQSMCGDHDLHNATQATRLRLPAHRRATTRTLRHSRDECQFLQAVIDLRKICQNQRFSPRMTLWGFRTIPRHSPSSNAAFFRRSELINYCRELPQRRFVACHPVEKLQLMVEESRIAAFNEKCARRYPCSCHGDSKKIYCCREESHKRTLYPRTRYWK